MTTKSILAACLLLLAAIDSRAATNQVLKIDAALNYVRIPDSDTLDVLNSFTVEAWVYSSNPAGNDQGVVAKRRNEGGTMFSLRVTQGRVGVGLNDNKVNFSSASASNSDVPANQWHHLSTTYDGSMSRTYVDGVLKASGAVKLAFKASAFPVTIGREDLPGDPRAFLGLIDEVRIWNRALSQEEIQTYMGLRLTGQEPGLRGYWNFDDGTANDSSLYQNHGTLVGGAQIVPDPLVLLQIAPAVELLTFSGLPEATYQLQFKTNASAAAWVNFGEAFAGGVERQFFDSTRQGMRIYRVLRIK